MIWHYSMKKRLVISLFLLIGMAGCASEHSRNEAGQVAAPVNSNHELPEVTLCIVPNPEVPSSAFDIYQSEIAEHSGYWVRYQCKQECRDWQQCLAPAYSDDNGQLLLNGRNPEKVKQALAFVVDGMGGHLGLTSDGNKTVFIHTGAGGTRYYIEPAENLEKMSAARTIMVRWEKGYTAPIVQAPFTSPITWGWYSRTSENPTNIKELSARVASIIAWSHENLSGSAMFGTLGCSMGTNATFGPVLWHGLDPIIDYQLFVGGPNMWDLNAQCNRREYSKGFCDYDAVSRCETDSDCHDIDEDSHCIKPENYTTIDKLFEQLPNHIHVTDACDIGSSEKSRLAHLPFDNSSMGFASDADWEIDHHMDFLVNLGARQGANYSQGLGGDEYWGLGHFPFIYNKIKPKENRQWKVIPDSHHCGAMYDEALDLIKERMKL